MPLPLVPILTFAAGALAAQQVMSRRRKPAPASPAGAVAVAARSTGAATSARLHMKPDGATVFEGEVLDVRGGTVTLGVSAGGVMSVPLLDVDHIEVMA